MCMKMINEFGIVEHRYWVYVSRSRTAACIPCNSPTKELMWHTKKTEKVSTKRNSDTRSKSTTNK